MKLLLRGYDAAGALVEGFTREVEVTQPGDGVYNVPTLPYDRNVPRTPRRRVHTVTVSVVE